MADGRTQDARGIKHALGVPDGDGFGIGMVLNLFNLQHLAHRLRNAQITRRQQDHEAVALFFVNDHLAIGADHVESGVGA